MASFGVFVAADDLMVVATMLRPIINDLGLVLPDDLDATAWIVNVYLIAYLTAMPLAGKLSDLFGRRSVFVAALGLFALGSVIVPSTSSFAVLLVGRGLSAAGGGALVPIALAVAGDLHSGRERTRALGLIGAIETLGWVWGPLYGAILVRLLSWQWQFYLNIPLALLGAIWGWRTLDSTRRTALEGGDRTQRPRIDWAGAFLLTVALAAVNVVLLSRAKIQSVTGLEELTGASSSVTESGWVAVLAAVALGAFVLVERRVIGRQAAGDAIEPIVGLGALRGRTSVAALIVNALVGVGLVVALVNVPLFVNVVNSADGIGATALASGVLLTALTAAMALTSYLGGIMGGQLGHRVPTALGIVLALAGFSLMGLSWDASTTAPVMALELALAGAGIGLVLAPTSDAVVDAAPVSERGSAAGLVIMARLIGFSVGLASLTAWGLHRYGVLRDEVELPAFGAEGYEDALGAAVVDITTTALAETFVGSALALVAALAVAGFLGGRRQPSRTMSEPPGSLTS